MTQESLRIGSLRDIERIEQQPLSARNLPRSTYELLCRSAERFSDNTALRFIESSEEYKQSLCISYRRLLDRVHQTANLLTDLGIGPNDVISVLLPNLPQTHFALWGGEAVGIVSPINPRLEPRQIEAILRDSKSRVLITMGPAATVSTATGRCSSSWWLRPRRYYDSRGYQRTWHCGQ